MTVTTTEHGQQNPFAKEEDLFHSDMKKTIERISNYSSLDECPDLTTDEAEALGNLFVRLLYVAGTDSGKAEKANSRFAMVGIIAAVVSYVLTGNLFFGVF
jgi:hypothetical protein